MTDKWTEIERRLVEAKGPDRGLDYAIYAVAIPKSKRTFVDWPSLSPPLFTASIDSALAILERCIAKDDLAAWDVGFAYNGGPYAARILTPTAEIEVTHEGSPALAICLAVIRALAASTHGTER